MSDQPLALRLADDMSLSYHSQTQKNEIATELRRQHTEIDELKAERDAYKRACEMFFHDDSGDLDYIKYYITKNVLSIEARNAIDAARGKT